MRRDVFTYIMFLLMAIALSSCITESEKINNPVEFKPQDGVEYLETSLSFDSAISNANFIYSNTENMTKKTRRISKVDLLTSADLNAVAATRSNGNEEVKNTPLAYIVNYADNQGYAILAADEQLPPVIAIGDSGTFSTEKFLQFVGGEEYTRTGSDITPAQEIQYAMVNNSLTLPVLPVYPNPATPTGHDTVLILKCMPLVPTKWGQGSPYNYYSPLDDNGNKCVAGCVPIAGAQVLTSLCYHHNFKPSVTIDSEYPVDWFMLNKTIYRDTLRYDYNEITPGSMNIASLVRAVGKYLNADYSATATSASTYNLTNLYSMLGLSSIEYGGTDSISTNDLFDMIVARNYPVNARASRIKDDNETVGHSFILDGWLRLEYNRMGMSQYPGSGDGLSFGVMDNIQHQFDLVHVNFGWNGTCDGYYLPGAFDASSDDYHDYAEENDNAVVRPYVYDIDVKYITYRLN